MEIVQSVLFLMKQLRKVWQGDPTPHHCWNQRGGIFKCRPQLGFSLRWTKIALLNFKKILSWLRPYRKRYKLRYAVPMWMSVCFKTHGHEDKFWNLWPMPTCRYGIDKQSHIPGWWGGDGMRTPIRHHVKLPCHVYSKFRGQGTPAQHQSNRVPRKCN